MQHFVLLPLFIIILLCMNAALLYNRMGLHNVLTFGPSVNGDYLLALAEEKRATSEEAKGKPAYHRKDKLGGFLHRRTVRWQKERMIQNM